jgi:hypothetical protein
LLEVDLQIQFILGSGARRDEWPGFGITHPIPR